MLEYDDILNYITKKNRISRVLFMIAGCFLSAIVYNLFVAPNNLVYGGMGGVSLIIQNYIHVSNIVVLNILSVTLIFLSLIIVGLKTTSYSIVGYIIYALMIDITEPITSMISINISSFLTSIIVFAIINGIGTGLIYRTGFNTGGGDSIVVILQKYFKIPSTTISTIVNAIIVVIGTATFGIVKTIYALFFLRIMNLIANWIILGTSSRKICFIKTEKHTAVSDIIKNKYNLGYSLLQVTNGVGVLKKDMIMCILPSDRYNSLKREIKTIDPKVTLITNNCYTVEGGIVNSIIPI